MQYKFSTLISSSFTYLTSSLCDTKVYRKRKEIRGNARYQVKQLFNSLDEQYAWEMSMFLTMKCSNDVQTNT